MTSILLRENRPRRLAEALGRVPSVEEAHRWARLARDAGRRLQRALGTSGSPLDFDDSNGESFLRAGGIAGTFRMGDREWTVVPKFVAEESVGGWERSVLTMVRRANRRAYVPEQSRRLRAEPLGLVDHFALAFAEAVDRALGSDPIHRYQTLEVESATVVGRLLMDRQLQHIFSRPHRFSCAVDFLDTNNDANQLLRWAALRFGEMTRLGAIRQQLQHVSELLPPVAGPVRLPARLPVVVPPQYAPWREAVAIATMLATGRSHGGGGGQSGYGLVLDMARVFEGFVDASLRDGLARQTDALWTASPQESRVFATADSPRTRSYWSRPDDVVRRDGASVLLVDAKYKLLADAEEGTAKRPSNADVYQLACSLVAHDVPRGLLVYPRVVLRDEVSEVDLGLDERKVWRVTIGDRALIIAAVAIDLRDLSTPDRNMALDEAIVGHVRAVLAIPT